MRFALFALTASVLLIAGCERSATTHAPARPPSKAASEAIKINPPPPQKKSEEDGYDKLSNASELSKTMVRTPYFDAAPPTAAMIPSRTSSPIRDDPRMQSAEPAASFAPRETAANCPKLDFQIDALQRSIWSKQLAAEDTEKRLQAEVSTAKSVGRNNTALRLTLEIENRKQQSDNEMTSMKQELARLKDVRSQCR